MTFLLELSPKNLKSFRVRAQEDKNKWSQSEENDNGRYTADKLFDQLISFEKLETLEISFFKKQLINIDSLFSVLINTKCQLKHLVLLGCSYPDAIFYYLKNFYSDSLESLKLSFQHYIHPAGLKSMTNLSHFSYTWENDIKKLDMIKLLMVLPKLTTLEVGFSRGSGELVNNIINADVYTSLNHLSFIGLDFKQHDLLNLGKQQILNIKILMFKNCKFGRSRTDHESTIDLGCFTLEKLTFESCSLYHSKKEKKNSRRIKCFKFGILQNEYHYVTQHCASNDDIKGALHASKGGFVYSTDNSDKLQINCSLLISVYIMTYFSVDKNIKEYIKFFPESEVIDLDSEDVSNVDVGFEDALNYEYKEPDSSIEEKVGEKEETEVGVEEEGGHEEAKEREEVEVDEVDKDEMEVEEDGMEESNTEDAIEKVVESGEDVGDFNYMESAKKRNIISISDDDYTCGDKSDNSTDSESDGSTDSESDKRRVNRRITKKSLRKRRWSSSDNYSSSDSENEESKIDSRLIADIVYKMKRYKTVINIKPWPIRRPRSPSL